MKEIIRKTSKFETPRERMNRMKILRQIRKQKLIQIGYLVQDTQVNNIQKDDKVHIQKLKNRQAAQTSRQQKKRYLTKLEQQIEQLKNRLQNSKFCQNCKKQLQIDDHVLPSETQNSTRQDSFLRNEIQIQQNQDSQMSQYWRVNSSGQNSSIGIYLFVFMVILGVFCLGSRADSDRSFNPTIRDLTQLYANPSQISAAPQSIAYEQNMRSSYSTKNHIPPINGQQQNGLVSLSSVKSLDSIQDDKCFEQIITSFEHYKMDTYEDKHLRSKSGIIDANKSLMFCSRPKIYKSNENNEGIFTAFIDIFVKGAEIINIFPQNGLQSTLSQNLQLNRLYKITASVEQIQQIGNMNYIY